MKNKHLKLITMLIMGSFLIISCSESAPTNEKASSPTIQASVKEVVKESIPFNPNMENKGIGPIESITLVEKEIVLTAKGENFFIDNCQQCHRLHSFKLGPSLAGVTSRRSPEWIMNMMLNTKVMLDNDPIAKALVKEYISEMEQPEITEEEARAVLEYLRWM